jgi:hypothetical protein
MEVPAGRRPPGATRPVAGSRVPTVPVVPTVPAVPTVPVVPTVPANVDDSVRWTPLLEAALSVLVERTDERVSLAGLMQEMRITRADPRLGALLARQLQDAERAGIVQIYKDSPSMPYYTLSRAGRVWAHGRLASEKLRRMTDKRRV